MTARTRYVALYVWLVCWSNVDVKGGNIEDKKEEGSSSNEHVDPPTPMDIEKTSE